MLLTFITVSTLNYKNKDLFKGQLILKANCQAEDSSKKRTNEFIFTNMRRVFVRFLEESLTRKKMFRDFLTFSKWTEKQRNVSFVKGYYVE